MKVTGLFVEDDNSLSVGGDINMIFAFDDIIHLAVPPVLFIAGIRHRFLCQIKKQYPFRLHANKQPVFLAGRVQYGNDIIGQAIPCGDEPDILFTLVETDKGYSPVGAGNNLVIFSHVQAVHVVVAQSIFPADVVKSFSGVAIQTFARCGKPYPAPGVFTDRVNRYLGRAFRWGEGGGFLVMEAQDGSIAAADPDDMLRVFEKRSDVRLLFLYR